MGRAYYNEFDPAAAAWLRICIAEGLIAPGDVDTRSIDEVRVADLRGYTQHHFFAGIGIWSHALRRAGWPDDRPVWTGSCPCQPFSEAGAQLGFSDPRHKWPAWFRLIGEYGPSKIFGEQVASAGLWLDLVQSDLEGRSFAFAAIDLPAAGFRGAHERQRFYWVADADNSKRWTECAAWDFADWPQAGRIESHGDAAERGLALWLAQPEGFEHDGSWDAGPGWGEPSDGSYAGRLEYATRDGRIEWGTEPGRRSTLGGRGHDWLAYTVGAAQGGHGGPGEDSGAHGPWGPAGEPWGDGAADWLGNAHGQRQQGWAEPDVWSVGPEFAASLGRDPGGWRGDVGYPGSAGLSLGSLRPDSRGAIRFQGPAPGETGSLLGCDWLLCHDAKLRPVGPGAFPLAASHPSRVGRLRGYGNALDAETATNFIAAFMEAEADLCL